MQDAQNLERVKLDFNIFEIPKGEFKAKSEYVLNFDELFYEKLMKFLFYTILDPTVRMDT